MITKSTVTATEITVILTDADIIDVIANRIPGMAALDKTLMTLQPQLTPEGTYNGGGIYLVYSESAQVGEDVP